MATPKLRFKEFDGNWKNYKLEDISNIKTGPFGSNLHKEDYVAVGTPIITVEHLGEISLTTQNLPLVSDTDKLRLSAYSLQEGDIAFSRVGSVDRCAIVTKQEKGWLFSGRILRVRPNNKIVFSKHLMYALKTEHSKHQIRSAAVGQTMPSLNTKILKEFIVCLSNSLEEQTKIATFLSAVDTKIDELTQKHELLTDYKKGMMQQIFSQKLRFKADDDSDFEDWEESLICNVFTNKSESFNPKVESNLPCIELEHLSQGTGTILGTTDSKNQKSTKNVFERSNVLYGKLRPYLNKFAQPDFKGVCSTEIWVLTGIEISNNYLYQYIQSESFSELTSIQSGSKMPRADWKTVASAVMSYPCCEEQTKIANFLTAIDQKIDNVAEQIDHAKTWKKGLLQQMFV